MSEKLVEQEQVLRHIRCGSLHLVGRSRSAIHSQDKRFLEADKIAQLQRTAKVDAEETGICTESTQRLPVAY